MFEASSFEGSVGKANNKITPMEHKAASALWQVRGRQAGEQRLLLAGVAREGLVDKPDSPGLWGCPREGGRAGSLARPVASPRAAGL